MAFVCVLRAKTTRQISRSKWIQKSDWLEEKPQWLLTFPLEPGKYHKTTKTFAVAVSSLRWRKNTSCTEGNANCVGSFACTFVTDVSMQAIRWHRLSLCSPVCSVHKALTKYSNNSTGRGLYSSGIEKLSVQVLFLWQNKWHREAMNSEMSCCMKFTFSSQFSNLSPDKIK